MAFLVSTTVFAKDVHLICMTGHVTDMDIKIESVEGNREKLSVILTAMDGVTIRKFVNSGFKGGALTQGLKNGKIQAIVSLTDLQASFEGAFLDAGVLELNTNKSINKHEVIFAAEGMVHTVTCTEQSQP